MDILKGIANRGTYKNVVLKMRMMIWKKNSSLMVS